MRVFISDLSHGREDACNRLNVVHTQGLVPSYMPTFTASICFASTSTISRCVIGRIGFTSD